MSNRDLHGGRWGKLFRPAANRADSDGPSDEYSADGEDATLSAGCDRCFTAAVKSDQVGDIYGRPDERPTAEHDPNGIDVPPNIEVVHGDSISENTPDNTDQLLHQEELIGTNRDPGRHER